MTIDLTKLKIRCKGLNPNDLEILTESGERVVGVFSMAINFAPGSLVNCAIGIQGISDIDLEESLATLNLDDPTLIKEVRRRGYTVTLDDSELEQELHQADEDSSQD